MTAKEVYDEVKAFRKEFNDKLDPICRLVTEHEVKIKQLEEKNCNNDKKKDNKIARYVSVGIALFTSLVAVLISIFK